MSITKRHKEEVKRQKKISRFQGKCPTPYKIAFLTEEEAARALSDAWNTMKGGSIPMRYYRCQCRMWHLTKKPLRIPKAA